MKKVSMMGLWLAVEKKLAQEGNKEIQQTIEARDKALQEKGLPTTDQIIEMETKP